MTIETTEATTAPGTVTPAAPRVTPDTAQQTFRAVLDALARPGTPVALPDAGPATLPVLLPVLALADLSTPVCVFGGDEATAEAIRAATSAPAAGPAKARLAAFLRPPEPGELAAVRTGSAAEPEQGALVCAAVPELPREVRAGFLGPEPTWECSGPGVPGARRLSGLPEHVVTERAALTAGFPAGADIVLVAPDGTAVGLPRSTSIVRHTPQGRG